MNHECPICGLARGPQISGLEITHDDSAPVVGILKGQLKALSAHHIPEDVNWAMLLQDFSEILRLVIEGDVDTQFVLHILHFVIGSSGGDNAETVRFSQLANQASGPSYWMSVFIRIGPRFKAYLPTAPAPVDTYIVSPSNGIPRFSTGAWELLRKLTCWALANAL